MPKIKNAKGLFNIEVDTTTLDNLMHEFGEKNVKRMSANAINRSLTATKRDAIKDIQKRYALTPGMRRDLRSEKGRLLRTNRADSRKTPISGELKASYKAQNLAKFSRPTPTKGAKPKQVKIRDKRGRKNFAYKVETLKGQKKIVKGFAVKFKNSSSYGIFERLKESSRKYINGRSVRQKDGKINGLVGLSPYKMIEMRKERFQRLGQGHFKQFLNLQVKNAINKL